MTADSHDVVIIGAGVSGLRVASGLIPSNLSVRVLEARGRVGGRIHSVPVAGGPIDLGPTWFWPGERRVETLAEHLGLAVHDHFDDGAALLAAGNGFRAVRVDMPASFRFSDGARALVEAMASRLPPDTIQLGVQVDQVIRQDDRVIVETSNGSMQATHVVIALPPSLAIARRMIDPALLSPEVARVAKEVAVWMGDTVKAVAVYSRPFWRDAGLSGMVSALQAPFREIHDMSGPNGQPAALFGFGGPGFDGSPEAGEVFVQQLTALFGPEAANPLETRVADWSREEFTSPPGPASPRFDLFGAPELVAPSWDGRLFWSSTETGRVAPGHIEGALEAADRTVAAITGG